MARKVKSVCFVVLSSAETNNRHREELKKAISALKSLSLWRIEKVTILEDNSVTGLP